MVAATVAVGWAEVGVGARVAPDSAAEASGAEVAAAWWSKEVCEHWPTPGAGKFWCEQPSSSATVGIRFFTRGKAMAALVATVSLVLG